MSLLFIQKRPVRAGAQTSLARLVESTPLREWNPIVLLGDHGWLEEQLRRQGVPSLVTPFPNPRSLQTRLFGLKRWSRAVAEIFVQRRTQVHAIVANDHTECPLSLALSRELAGVPVLAILRTPGMTRRDFDKYNCEQCHGLMGVGTEMQERLTHWTSKPVGLFEEGFAESEFKPPRPWPATCPRRIVVIGSEAPRKGFIDFMEAVHRLEKLLPDFPGFDCDLTGNTPEGATALLAEPTRSSFRFIGRVEGFADCVQQYELAIHPSRSETFGLAPIEAMIAGTPTLVSVTGVIDALDLPPEWTFPASDVTALTDRLADLWLNWPPMDMARLQERIRHDFHIDRTAGALCAQLKALNARGFSTPI